MNATHQKEIVEIKTPPQLANRQFNAEAVDKDGNILFCRVTYNHSTRGTWTAILGTPGGLFLPLDRVPNIRTARWVKLTKMGQCVVEDGRE
jgi:hypothetical protein